MSRHLQLEHFYEAIPNTKQDVKDCLFGLIMCDNDFNGENGYEYLWEDAYGFESNADYCWSIAEKKPTPREMIEEFIYLWMGRDAYYYDYSLGILERDGKLFVSLAYVTEY